MAATRNHDVHFIERLVALERKSLASAQVVFAETHNARQQQQQQQTLGHAPLMLDLGSNRDREDFVRAIHEHQNEFGCLRRRHANPNAGTIPLMQRRTQRLSVRDCTMGVRVSDFAGQTQYYTLHSLVRASSSALRVACWR